MTAALEAVRRRRRSIRTRFPLKDGLYGNQICFPLPDVERNNNPTLGGKTS